MFICRLAFHPYVLPTVVSRLQTESIIYQRHESWATSQEVQYNKQPLGVSIRLVNVLWPQHLSAWPDKQVNPDREHCECINHYEHNRSVSTFHRAQCAIEMTNFSSITVKQTRKLLTPTRPHILTLSFISGTNAMANSHVLSIVQLVR